MALDVRLPCQFIENYREETPISSIWSLPHTLKTAFLLLADQGLVRRSCA